VLALRLIRSRGARLGLAALACAAFWTLLWLAHLAVQAHALVHDLHDDRPLPTIGAPSPESHIDPRLSHVASVLAGRGVEVRCWSVGDWVQLDANRRRLMHDERRTGLRSGFTSFDRKRIDLGTAACADLAHIAYEPLDRPHESWDDLAWAVNLLGHESTHARGTHDERRAECEGMQAIPRTSRLLGLNATEGRYLALLYWSRLYPLMGDYRSAECRDGGGLDIHPETDVWP
jgi:hypothetical protein